MKISIVTSYYNRKQLFINTIKSIIKTKHKDYELIVIDDGSKESERLEDIAKAYSFIKLIRIEPKNKWYKNPCVPFNIGIKHATGDIIILQNPECFHVHDILTYVNDNIKSNDFISFSCYAINKQLTDNLQNIKEVELLNWFASLPQQPSGGDPTIGWYNHSKLRPVYFHFCAAISKENLINKLNGFDERYAKGIARDDAELLLRIKRLKLNMVINDNLSVIHQWHPTVFYNQTDFRKLYDINKTLYNQSLKETIIKANT